MKKREYRIDLGGVRSARALHARLDGKLPFPEGYGRNLDALYDFLTEYGPRLRIVFENAKGAPASLKRLCADAVAGTPGLEIVFENAKGAPASLKRLCADAVAGTPGLEIVFA